MLKVEMTAPVRPEAKSSTGDRCIGRGHLMVDFHMVLRQEKDTGRIECDVMLIYLHTT